MRYRSHRDDDADLRSKLRELAQQRRRFGYRRLHILLRREGIVINRKKTQQLYREEKLAGSGLEPLFPVWGIPTGELAEQMIDGGLCARLACVDTRHLDESFVGREFDRSLLRDLPVGIDPCGERGEFHSCVYAGPMFREPIALRAGDTHAVSPFVWRDLTVAADPLNGVGSHFQVTSVPEK